MRIVHFAPFAPNACGLYEAARDMVIADCLAGHEVHLVDVGITSLTGEHVPGSSGRIDNRGGSYIVTSDPLIVDSADVLIAHTGVPDNWISRCQAPIVWIMHGRPAACFRPEQFGKGHSYSLMVGLSRWPRIKKMVTFWQHHMQYWEPVIPKEKLICLDVPPVDGNRFSPDGPVYDLKDFRGQWNVLIADSWREDIDIYEVVHGLFQIAELTTGVKFHFCAVENPLGPWEHIFAKLKEVSVLGEVSARMLNMEERYRAVDLVLSPHRIATRVIIEALSCGVPVVAAEGCDLAQYTMKPDEPGTVASSIARAIVDLEKDKKSVLEKVEHQKQRISLKRYSEQMKEVYKSVVGG